MGSNKGQRHVAAMSRLAATPGWASPGHGFEGAMAGFYE
jgi:hypothetical protein